jgi:hypothetical protein
MSSHSDSLQLQLNNKGAWKTVVAFGQQDMEDVKRSAQALHAVDTSTNWRITTGAGRSPGVLSYLGRNTYGLWIGQEVATTSGTPLPPVQIGPTHV